jgi:hypothetical protein
MPGSLLPKEKACDTGNDLWEYNPGMMEVMKMKSRPTSTLLTSIKDNASMKNLRDYAGRPVGDKSKSSVRGSRAGLLSAKSQERVFTHEADLELQELVLNKKQEALTADENMMVKYAVKNLI